MRFGLTDLPFWLLLLLPLYATYNGYGLIATAFLLTLWFLVRELIIFHTLKTRGQNKKLILETLPGSPYVEKVRWCMDKLGIDYEEEQDIGIMGSMLLGRMVPTLKVPGKCITISNSSDILRFLYGTYSADSDQVGQFLKPTKEAIEMEAKLDEVCYNLRQWRYHQALTVSDKSNELILTIWGVNVPGVPQWQKVILNAIQPVLRVYVKNGLKISSEEAEMGLRRAKAFFQETDKLLSDGRKYLFNTDEPTFVDIAFASLSTMLVLSDEYGGRALPNDCKIHLEDMPPGAQKEIRDFRNSPSGKFAMRMYQEHRLK